ncbi:MAG: PstS family phosphate ABC transporter substrate-binding protein, partial [Solirubrobacterales bacterium]
MSSKRWLVLGAAGVLALSIAACGDDNGGGGGLSGTINLDGSSTVFPFAQAAAEGFNKDNPDVKVTVGESGTGGGFEKFCAGETDISDASRPIEPEEIAACKKGGVGYDELQVASDGIAVVTNPAIEVSCLSTDQLKQLWNKGSTVKNLSELGNDGETNKPLPSAELGLYGPGTDSGTFDFFTDKINGEEGVSRTDYQPSEDDNVLVEGVAGDEGGLGYFGFSYFEQNQDKLNLVSVDGGDGCIAPSTETIQDESYFLSRPLFMYPSAEASKSNPAVIPFLQYVEDNYKQIAETAKIVPMPADKAAESKTKF